MTKTQIPMTKESGYDLKERTKAFALRIVKLSAALPTTREGNVIGHQVLRSGTSIGANYAEADSARSKAEFAAKVGDSMKEASETVYWLELLAEAEIVEAAKLADLLQEAGELKSILASIYNKTKA